MKSENKLTLLSLCAVALNLRPALATLGPVTEPLRHDLQLSYGAAGLLTTLPVLCMGFFAPVTPHLQARLGLHRSIAFSMLLLAIALLLRALPNYLALLVSSAVAGACLAVLGPLLNAFIKQRYAGAVARTAGWAMTALCFGAALGASGTAALSTKISWSNALAAWSAPAFIALIGWQATVPADSAQTTAQVKMKLPWRKRKAWQLLFTFGLHSSVFYCLLAWLAPAYEDLGLSRSRAGQLLGVFALTQIVGSLAVSALPKNHRDRRLVLFLFGAIIATGLFALWRMPLWLPEVWMAALGASTAGLFALTMILPLDYSGSAEEAGAWTAMMCGGGYIIAALGPLLVGWIRDVSGSYRQVFLGLLGVSLVVLMSTLGLGPRKLAAPADE